MHAKKTIQKLKAITLVELSIVLAVMGLLISATLVGTQIIKQAQIRSIITHLQDAEKAIYQFLIAHEYLPGDFPNALDLWSYTDFQEKCTGYDNGTAINDFTSTNKGFNGNGDAIVGVAANSASAGSVAGPDTSGVFCHLVLGGFMKTGNTVITRVPTSTTAQLGKAGMSPDGKNSIYLIGANTATDNLLGKHALYMIGPDSTAADTKQARTSNLKNTVSTSKDLMAIDIKIDDGLPGTGRIIMFNDTNGIGTNSSCCVKKTTTTGSAPKTTVGTGLTGSSKKCIDSSYYNSKSTGKNACYMAYTSKMF
ncbi:hypothetical protein CAXC1_260021 [Candidatus Xenohaliotis californiensis]|uniref:Prepilin-type N-terminal cleavage/methylation domain-containing protein n=1 Tax=Candidatus Xenohaliotis californiensis TaxID=84677 RepID=A0ABP0EVH3_9RICK|nr:hypothetical protein CAXC1_260021 [Candidatus Xenohaliotis californiensis]